MSGYYAIEHSGVTKEGRESGVLGVGRRQSATLTNAVFFSCLGYPFFGF